MQYPGNGPYFTSDLSVAQGFQQHGPYENGLQEIHLDQATFDELVAEGLIRPDGAYDEGVSWHVPPDGLPRFNEAMRQTGHSVYHPQS